MAAPTSRLRPLSLLPRAANAAHLRPLFPLRPLLPPLLSALSAFSSSSPENGGLGSEKTHSEGPEGIPSPRFEQRLLPQRKEAALIERARKLLSRPPADWRHSTLLAALTPTQAARVAISHPDAASALELLHFLSREHSHKYLPDTFSTLAIRLVNSGNHPAVGRARIHMIKSCRNQAEMTRSMDDLDMLSRRGAKMGLFAYSTLLIHLNRLNMTATVMNSFSTGSPVKIPWLTFWGKGVEYSGHSVLTNSYHALVAESERVAITVSSTPSTCSGGQE